MKYAIGYQFADPGEESLVEMIQDFRESIEEVYFAWLGMPSGRSPATSAEGIVNWDSQMELEKDMRILHDMGIKLNLLFNATCYGRHSLSQHLANTVCSVVAYLKHNIGLDVVTTASLMIARVIKKNFKDIDIRASVNMRIGTIKGLEYLEGIFDSFYMQREYNRDIERIEGLKEWCDSHNKKVYILANSGCMNFCSGQTFHDNLVAHTKEISEMRNVRNNPILCQEYYRKKEHWLNFLQSSWIRPEDIAHYDNYSSVIKLATRTHSNPRKVIQAYADRKFNGNLLDLLEPGYGYLFSPYIIDNTRFPSDWFKKITGCDKKCDKCDYCKSVLEKVLVKMKGEI